MYILNTSCAGLQNEITDAQYADLHPSLKHHYKKKEPLKSPENADDRRSSLISDALDLVSDVVGNSPSATDSFNFGGGSGGGAGAGGDFDLDID